MHEFSTDDLVNHHLSALNGNLSDAFDGDVLLLKSPMGFGVDNAVKRVIEQMAATPQKNNGRLIVVLETNGGFIEVVERIHSVFRNHYTTVEFIIPNYAYSAGTVLALSGDEIYMDYYSVLGPIDPQMPDENGTFVPGMGYLSKYNELCDHINTQEALRLSGAPAQNVSAEVAYLLKKFDPAHLFHIEQAVEHSKSLLREWLPKHKFKNWTTTATNGNQVTDADRVARANQIASVLGDASRWHSHGRGIGMRELASEEIKLKVEDFGAEPAKNQAVRTYYNLFVDFCGKIGMSAGLHTHLGLVRL